MSINIETKSLRYVYPGDEDNAETVALDDVTLSIERGSFVVVLGHNGS